MKKHFYSLFAAAAMMLAVTSCSQEEDFGQQSGGDLTTFSVVLDGATLSRTAGDGTTVNQLYYEVYQDDKIIYDDVKQISAGKTSVDLQLMKGETYQVTFWAQNSNSIYDATNLQAITATYNSPSANNEAYDAFFNSFSIKANGGEQTVYLYRPFAQLNVGTSKADWETAKNLLTVAGKSVAPVKESQVTVKGLANTFNAVTGKAEGNETVIFNKADISAEEFTATTENKTFINLAMNYLLVPGEEAPKGLNGTPASLNSNVKTNVDVEVTFWQEGMTDKLFNLLVANAPIQRNYRTNIIGDLLADASKFNVEVVPGWGGEEVTESDIYVVDDTYHILTAKGLQYFAQLVNGEKTMSKAAGGMSFANNTVVLENNIDLEGIEWTPIGSGSNYFEGTFDGNNKTVKDFKVTTKEGYAGLFGYARAEFKNLTVEEVTITANHYAGGIVGQGYCNFDNCHAKNVDITLTTKNNDWGDKAGGIIGQNCEGAKYIKNCTAEDVTIKGYRDLGGIAGMAHDNNIVSGCSVKDITIEQDLTVDYKQPTPTTLAGVVGRKGSNVTYENNTEVNAFVATKNTGVLATLLTSDTENISIKLLEDTEIAISSLGQQTGGSGEYKLGGENTKSITIDLNEKKLTITTTYWSSLGAKNADALFTIKNGTMTSSQENGTWNSYDLTFANCNYAIENVVFSKAIAFTNAGKEAALTNVTINETHDYYAMWVSAKGQILNIDNLTINSTGRGIKIDEQYVSEPAKVTMNIKNSTFKTAKKAAILVKSVEGAEINAENLNIAEVAADTKFAVWVDEDSKNYADKVVVNGAYKKVEGTNVVLAGSQDDLPKTEDGKIDTSFEEDVVLSGDITVSASETNANSSYGAIGISVDNGAVLDGNGKTLTVNDANGTWDCVVQAKNGTIKNLTVKGAMRGIFMGSATGDVYIDNVIFKDVVYTFNSDGGNKEYGVYISNCTINGWTSHSNVHKEVVYTNCKFGKGSGYAFCRPYGKTVYKNCEFSTDMQFDTSRTSDITFENCTYGGVKITAENAASLKTGDVTFFYDGVNSITIK